MSKTVLVTGATSFLGCHVSSGFARAGYSVIATSRRPRNDYSGVQLKRLNWLGGHGVTLERLELGETAVMQALLEKYSPLLWVYQAGFTTGYDSLHYDTATGERVNVKPLYEIYPLLERFGCRGVIVPGSSMEYSHSNDACSELSPCNPATPYGVVKLAQTDAALRLSGKYNLPTRVARVFIPFGPMEDSERVLPTVATALGLRRHADLSPCLQVRDFMHVDDLVRAYLCLADDLSRGGAEVYNVCSGIPTQLRELCLCMAEVIGASPELLRFGSKSMRPAEPMVSYGTCDKLTSIGWHPTPLLESIKTYLLKQAGDLNRATA